MVGLGRVVKAGHAQARLHGSSRTPWLPGHVCAPMRARMHASNVDAAAGALRRQYDAQSFPGPFD